jgi:protein TonB
VWRALGGALAIHAVLAGLAIALLDTLPDTPPTPVPRIDLVDILPPPPEIVTPPPPPDPAPAVAPAPVDPPTAAPPKATPHPAQVRTAQPPPSSEPPPPVATPPSPDSGGGPVTQMEDIAPAAHGIPVAKGVRKSGTGTGTGTGTGSGTGAGSSDAPPTASIAMIKTPAKPTGDYDYVSTKDYPPEAAALGIAGDIRVRLVVDPTGAVKTATLLNRLGHGLDEVALTRAKAIRFEPARDADDHPVQSVLVWTFHMNPPK